MKVSKTLLAVAAALMLVCSFGSAVAECIDYGDYLHWAGSVDTRRALGVSI